MTFSEEKVIFNSACLFRLELEAGREHLLFLDFELVQSTFTKLVGEGAPLTSRKANVVDRRRIYVNHYGQLNCFTRVLFDDSDYFSLSDVYLLAQPLGEKVRLHEYQLGEFQRKEQEERQLLHHEAFEAKTALGMNKKVEFMGHFQMGVEDFYQKMIGEKLLRHRKLCQIYQKFQYYMSSLSSSSPGQADIDQLEWLRVDEGIREGQLMELYQTEQIPELFFLIYE